jgi:hypothetical protein
VESERRVWAFGGYGGSLVVIDVDRRMTFHEETALTP